MLKALGLGSTGEAANYEDFDEAVIRDILFTESS
jgi:hypothetical protein